MKNIIYSLFVCFAFICISCDDDSTKDMSQITYFVDLEIEGDVDLFWPKGTSFVDPGYTAFLNGEDIHNDVVITGSVNSDEAGIYNLKYAAVNDDGFTKELYRTVYVYDPTESPIVSTIYAGSKDNYRSHATVGTTPYGNSYPVVIFQTEPGVFYVSDFFSGYYDKRAGYGSAYAMTGTFKLKEDNTLEAVSSHIDGWGDSIDGLTGKYDPDTESFYWEVGYAGSMTFYITLTK